jgi:hypothetical protein
MSQIGLSAHTDTNARKIDWRILKKYLRVCALQCRQGWTTSCRGCSSRNIPGHSLLPFSVGHRNTLKNQQRGSQKRQPNKHDFFFVQEWRPAMDKSIYIYPKDMHICIYAYLWDTSVSVILRRLMGTFSVPQTVGEKVQSIV